MDDANNASERKRIYVEFIAIILALVMFFVHRDLGALMAILVTILIVWLTYIQRPISIVLCFIFLFFLFATRFSSYFCEEIDFSYTNAHHLWYMKILPYFHKNNYWLISEISWVILVGIVFVCFFKKPRKFFFEEIEKSTNWLRKKFTKKNEPPNHDQT